jgi:methylated-DNA-[protein]-cysteine S-methyltransferase
MTTDAVTIDHHLWTRFRDRASDAGLVDVAYATVDSPIGRLLVAGTRKGLVRVAFETEDADSVLEELATELSPRVLEAPAKLDFARRELDDYFEGRLQRFALPVDWSLSRGFTGRVLHRIARIPYGSVLSYAEIAKRLGAPRAARAVGNACGSNPIPIVVPCHRVVRTGGALGGYGGGLPRKRWLLALEGAGPTSREAARSG